MERGGMRGREGERGQRSDTSGAPLLKKVIGTRVKISRSPAFFRDRGLADPTYETKVVASLRSAIKDATRTEGRTTPGGRSRIEESNRREREREAARNVRARSHVLPRSEVSADYDSRSLHGARVCSPLHRREKGNTNTHIIEADALRVSDSGQGGEQSRPLCLPYELSLYLSRLCARLNIFFRSFLFSLLSSRAFLARQQRLILQRSNAINLGEKPVLLYASCCYTTSWNNYGMHIIF